jgi:hypothetical protein
MFSVVCVLRSGGIYDASWVEKLQRGVARHLSRPHRFYCLSDVDVPCERVPMLHNWPTWYSKLELMRPGVITGDTLYIDLDTAITGSLDGMTNFDSDFAMIRSFANPQQPASGVMWFRKVPHEIYHKFAKQPEAWIAHYDRTGVGAHIGDQGFISDHLANIDFLTDMFDGIRAYKYHCKRKLLPGTAVVCFQGKEKMTTLPSDHWVNEHWR